MSQSISHDLLRGFPEGNSHLPICIFCLRCHNWHNVVVYEVHTSVLIFRKFRCQCTVQSGRSSLRNSLYSSSLESLDLLWCQDFKQVLVPARHDDTRMDSDSSSVSAPQTCR